MSFHVLVNISSLEKCLFRSIAEYLNVLFVFLLLSCNCSLYILYTSPLSDIYGAKTFFPCCGLSFYFLIGILWSTKVFNFDDVQYICFFFHFLFLTSHLRFILVFKFQLLQDQVDELQSELQEYRTQGRVFRLPLKNSLSEELDINSGCIEPDQGKPVQTPSFQSLCLWLLIVKP